MSSSIDQTEISEILKTLDENEKLIFLNRLLVTCSKNNNIEMVKFLIERGANIHYDNDYCLNISVRKRHFDIVKLLVENGADIHYDNDFVLRWSAENGHLEIVKFLVEKGANIHTNNDYALRLSITNNHLQVVKLLIENGANVESITNEVNKKIARYFSNKSKYYLDGLVLPEKQKVVKTFADLTAQIKDEFTKIKNNTISINMNNYQDLLKQKDELNKYISTFNKKYIDWKMELNGSTLIIS